MRVLQCMLYITLGVAYHPVFSRSSNTVEVDARKKLQGQPCLLKSLPHELRQKGFGISDDLRCLWSWSGYRALLPMDHNRICILIYFFPVPLYEALSSHFFSNQTL